MKTETRPKPKSPLPPLWQPTEYESFEREIFYGDFSYTVTLLTLGGWWFWSIDCDGVYRTSGHSPRLSKAISEALRVTRAQPARDRQRERMRATCPLGPPLHGDALLDHFAAVSRY